MKKTAELKVLPVSVLKPAEYNPRKKLKPGDKEYEKIKNSIEEFGFADPLVINADMTIIGGHQRLTVAIAMGYTEVPCAVVDVDKVREKALNIALNKITGAWDEQMLADLLTDLKESDYDLDWTGFDAPEVEALFSNIYDKKVKEDDFDVDEELKQPVFSKLDDLWLIGRHRVICGDSTGEEVYTKLMDGQQANLVLTDPPYNVDVEETAGKIMNDNMGDQEFYNFLLSAYRCMHANLADDGSIYVWHADTEGLNFRKAFKDAGFYLSGCCIWKKNSLVLGRSPYQWIHEPCLFGWKQKGKHQWYADRKQTTVWEYDKPRSSKDHPTMKPINLMSYPIKNSTMTNGIVLDPFLGSGSTLIACCETERVCRGIELDPKFVDVIVKRYIEWNGGKFDDVYVMRDGQKLRFDEVATFDPQEVADE
jgi:site-specific DNA-methyltransferase (adenine-specific)